MNKNILFTIIPFHNATKSPIQPQTSRIHYAGTALVCQGINPYKRYYTKSRPAFQAKCRDNPAAVSPRERIKNTSGFSPFELNHGFDSSLYVTSAGCVERSRLRGSYRLRQTESGV